MFEKLQQSKLVDGLLMLGIALVAVGVGINLKTSTKTDNKLEIIKATVSPTKTVEKTEVIIYMEGEVVKPGVYKLARGSRIEDALIVSGGLAVNADRIWVEKNINKAEIVVDGMKIYIPKIGEIKIAASSGDDRIPRNDVSGIVLGVQKSNIININTAGVNELDKLSGVGPAIAERIIDYRNQNGGFKDINELKLVSGIGDKMFEKIKDQVGI